MFAGAKRKQQKQVRQLQCQEQCIDHIPYYLSRLSRAHFLRQPFSKQLYTGVQISWCLERYFLRTVCMPAYQWPKQPDQRTTGSTRGLQTERSFSMIQDFRQSSGTTDLSQVSKMLRQLRACLHGGGGPQVGEVTCLAGVKKSPSFTCNLTTPPSRGAVSQDY